MFGGVWRFVGNPEYSIVLSENEAAYEGKALKQKDMLYANIYGAGKVFIVVKETTNTFTVYTKFNIEGVDRIQIGSGNMNHLQYDFRMNNKTLISKNHAAIIRYNNEYYLADDSQNGSFINEKRVVGASQKLEFGDLINIYGLKIIYLNSIIKITNYIFCLLNISKKG